MSTRSRQRAVDFSVADNFLVRTVTFPEGRSYIHRCTQASYEAIAYAVDQAPKEGEGLALGDIAKGLDLPYSQANVALEFMKERGVLVTRARRNYPASSVTFEDAMIEYHARREGAAARA